MNAPLAELTQALRDTHPGQILFVTGAGISLASGIPTFRGSDAGAIWKKDVTELGTHRFFLKDPCGSWQWYLSRFAKVEGARPNAGHLALAALERWQVERGGDFLLVTQNIDTLHEQAGSTRMVKVHGTSDRYRCDRYGCSNGPPRGSIAAKDVDLAPFLAKPSALTVPRCPRCGGFLRMHVLWFDEVYTGHDDYKFDTVVRSADRDARLVVFIGTSFSVGVTSLVLDGARMRGIPVFNIDPTPRVDEEEICHVALPSEVALVEVCSALGVTVPEAPAGAG